MSEAKQEPQEKPAAQAAKSAAPAAAAAAPAAAPSGTAPATPAAKKPNTAPIVLIAVVVLALGAGAAIGSLLIAPGLIRARQTAAAEAASPHLKKAKQKPKKKDKGGEHGEAGKPSVYKLDNIIVNPADSQGQRFLMCTVAIESDDSKALDILREHEIELRDRVVTLLSRQPMDRLTAQNARDSLRAELFREVHPVLGEEGEDVELKIFLPQFVVQ